MAENNEKKPLSVSATLAANSGPQIEMVKKTNPIFKVLTYIGLVVWAVINLFPVYYLITFSLKDNSEVLGDNKIGLPRQWLWSNYVEAWTSGRLEGELPPILRYFLNSIIIAVFTILLTLLVAVMATYALTRLRWKGRGTVNKLFMLGLTIPIHASLLPLFLAVSRLHLTNGYLALVLSYSAFALSMAILICTGFMSDIPIELDEAAYIDGCGTWGTFFKIIMPLMRPALSTIGIYTFLQSWNELLFASIFNSGKAYRTLPYGISMLFGTHTTEWGPVGAGLTIATLPTLLVYVFLSGKIQASFMAGAVKG